MSFLITVYVNEGIVMASDRRITYSNTINNGALVQNNIGTHVTDNTDKTFLCPNGSGISVCGTADIDGKPITGFIHDMIRKNIKEDTSVSDIPKIIWDYFKIGKGLENSDFIIAGFEEKANELNPKVFKMTMNAINVEDSLNELDTNFQGAIWDGEIHTLTRLIQPVAAIDNNGTHVPLPQEPIQWQYFTLQDAVDFARFAVETTTKTMHFKNVIETVGGNVDILIIKPEKSYWLQKEELH